MCEVGGMYESVDVCVCVCFAVCPRAYSVFIRGWSTATLTPWMHSHTRLHTQYRITHSNAHRRLGLRRICAGTVYNLECAADTPRRVLRPDVCRGHVQAQFIALNVLKTHSGLQYSPVCVPPHSTHVVFPHDFSRSSHNLG